MPETAHVILSFPAARLLLAILIYSFLTRRMI